MTQCPQCGTDHDHPARAEGRRHALFDFVRESNRIEGIERDPTADELAESERFIRLPQVTLADLERFVSVCQPGAVLRNRPGLNVIVGNHRPPPGGPWIVVELEDLLVDMHSGSHPHGVHVWYETLHPFTDGNGRSGRILWAWQMENQHLPFGGLRLLFLHAFYYQTLQQARREVIEVVK